MKQLKANVLKQIIEEDIAEMKRRGNLTKSVFAIHIEDGVEVQICVTKEEDELIDEVYTRYEEAED